MRVTTRIIIALALFASLLSFAKFSYCADTQWQSPGQYIHACYSDIPALYGERDLKSSWPYSSKENAVEYPVITGVIMWVTAQAIPEGATNYFNFSALLLALLFIFIAWITFRIRPEFAYLLPVAPAVIASLYINWDVWAIATMMLAIYLFDKNKLALSAIALAISIATKFMPVVLLVPIALIFLRQERISQFFRYVAITFGTWAAINAPIFLTTPEGWKRFYVMNLERGSDWGSIWYALSNIGLDLTHQNYLSVLTLLIGFTLLALLILQFEKTPSLAHVAIFAFVIMMAVSKVYSPQYVLWLTPLAVIALIDRRDIAAFWVWMGCEVIYHFAIWQHLAQVTGARFGLGVFAYSLITLLRIAASIYLVVRLAARHKKSRGFPLEFLFHTASSYP
jgi:uncharacterized membrane protein